MGMMRDEIVELARLIVEKQISRILVMGVQSLLSSVDVIINDFNTFNIPIDQKAYKQLKEKDKINALGMLQIIQCVESVDALDYSNYEGANIICDLNISIEGDSEKYDLVIDGGTLEHIYNVANAMNNMNSFVKPGGYIYHLVPCAGWVNHGFYSFSPTFFVDAYSKESGFELLDCKMLFKQPKGQRDRLLFSQDCRLINTFEVNRLISDANTSGGVLLKCLAKKCNDVKYYVPEQSMYEKGLWIDQVNEKEIMNRVVNEVKQYSSGVYLYGAGTWFNKILDQLIKMDLYDRVEGVFESDEKKVGTTIRGKRIYYPTKNALAKANVILISTIKYQNEVYKMVKQNFNKANIVCLLNKNCE